MAAERHWSRVAARLRGAKAEPVRHGPPALAAPTRSAVVQEGDDWLHELKLDGYRMALTVADQRIRFWSRQGVEWTDHLAPLAKAWKLPTTAVVDAELVAGAGRQADFSVLQETIAARDTAGLRLVAFDLLNVAGIDVRPASAIARRQLLLAWAADASLGATLATSSHIHGHGTEALALSNEQGFEGIVSKRAAAAYPSGRTRDWLKTKNSPREVLAIAGVVGEYVVLARPSASGWDYAGRARRRDVDLRTAREQKVSVARLNAQQAARLKGTAWLEPTVFVEVDHHHASSESSGRAFRHVRIVRQLVAKP